MFAFGNVELFIQTESGVGFLTGVIEQLDHNEHSIIVANTKYLKKCVHLRWGMRSSWNDLQNRKIYSFIYETYFTFMRMAHMFQLYI